MPDELRPLRSGRYYSEAELAAHAYRAVLAAVGPEPAKPYRTRKELADALDIEASALSAGIALGDPHRQEAATGYDRGKSVRRLILQKLLGYDVLAEPSYSVAESAPGTKLAPPAEAD